MIIVNRKYQSVIVESAISFSGVPNISFPQMRIILRNQELFALPNLLSAGMCHNPWHGNHPIHCQILRISLLFEHGKQVRRNALGHLDHILHRFTACSTECSLGLDQISPGEGVFILLSHI